MRFIVFEGLDGSGKSSLINALEKVLTAQAQSYVRTREPGGTELGENIRKLILQTQGQAPTPRAELLLYEASRAQHVDKVIRPALNSGQWVLCDRFSASSIAFQSGGREISQGQVQMLNEFATGNLHADLTVLIDVPVSTALQRIHKRSHQTGEAVDRIELEKEDFHQKVRQSFLDQAQADQKKWLVLSGENTPDQLLQGLLQRLRGEGWLA